LITSRKLSSDHGNDNIADPVHLDLTKLKPGLIQQTAFICRHVLYQYFQVAPISIADGMMECASNLLDDDGFLLIMAPFRLKHLYHGFQ